MTTPEPLRVVIFAGDVPHASPSPACMKLLTWLRMANIPYETALPAAGPRSSTGKVPYLELPDGTVLADSAVIIDRLVAERGVALDAHLSVSDQAAMLAFRRLVEDHLYFAVLTQRWLDDRQWPVTRAAYFGFLPGPLRLFMPSWLRRKVRRDAHGQGLARRPLVEVYEEGANDVRALAALLGDKPWFFGSPSTFDAVAYGTLVQLPVWDTPPWPTRDALMASPNLLAWLARMQAAYWPDPRARSWP